ncbi:MAG: tetratricopeptide repeat protein [Gammaproteobacteria bacterium]|jgi:TolB-like protein/DNA-binding winged helix-turn-helix (wHTH) protein/Flp pilus assembly protein TadD|nr:tetratricopeptide repeat protein [Gammaproteobacteria bacterium]
METPTPTRQPALTEAFRIGDWCVHVSAHQLSKHDRIVKLEPRTMDVLLYLAERAGETVPREQLEDDVWEQRVVGYDALNITISKLRKALDDDPKNPRIIETIPKVGYRFIGRIGEASPATESVQIDGRETPGAQASTAEPSRRVLLNRTSALLFLASIVAAIVWFSPWNTRDGDGQAGMQEMLTSSDKPSIAVLPFDNLSGDPEQEYFSDGITDDLITDLSKLSGLMVIARNSVFAYKGKPTDIREIARQLGVRYVLEGSVRKAKDTVRINAQLVDASTGSQLWADRYDGPLADVFTLQDDVTGRIVAALKVRLTPEEQKLAESRGTRKIAAYDAFLKGWAHLLRKTPQNAAQAVTAFEHALQLDPNYSRAYAALAQAYWDNSIDPEFNVLVGPPMHASTHVGYTGFISAWRYLHRASETPSSQANALFARMLQRQRRFGDAMEAAVHAVALGPNDPVAYDVLIETLIYAGETEQALQLIDNSMGLDPHLPGEKLFLKGMAYYTMGRLDEAQASIRRARSHNPKQSRYAAIEAAALAELGRTEEATAALQDYLSGLVTYTTLNWVMFYWPYQDPETAGRLARGLIEAGLPATPRRYHLFDAGDRLDGDDIKRVLSGKTMLAIDKSYYGGDDFRVTRNRDMQIVAQDFLTYFGDGSSRIENDLLCDPWISLGDYCVAIYRNSGGSTNSKDEYVFFTLMNTFTFSIVE